jgi:hypothetical protein
MPSALRRTTSRGEGVSSGAQRRPLTRPASGLVARAAREPPGWHPTATSTVTHANPDTERRHGLNGSGTLPGLPAALRLATALGVPVERFAEGVEAPTEE